MLGNFGYLVVPLIILIAIIGMSLRVLREYERGVVFFLGRFQRAKGPGLVIVIPVIQQMVKVDLRIITL
ncbi:MAG TPA: SPFH domain-containing protein, partial [Guyparkeria sp.]|nr:SPFH domain-containing protein [Guyparkeria sp.]